MSQSKIKSPTLEKSIAATLYPDKIIIVTRNRKDPGTWYSTDFFTILAVDIDSLTLGRTMINHLEESTERDISYDQIKSIRDNFRKKSKFKTEKAVMQDAKYVSIFLLDNVIRFESYKNMVTKGGQKEFYRIPDSILALSFVNDYTFIGEHLRNAWEKCKFA